MDKYELKVKLETLALLRSYPKRDKGYTQHLLDIAKTLDSTGVTNDDVISLLLKDITKIIKGIPLSRLTLKDDEFTDTLDNGFSINNRYPFITMNKTDDGIIYRNNNAYSAVVNKIYNYTHEKEIFVTGKHTHSDVLIFITKGGVVTGDYIYNCYLKESDITLGFNRFDPIELPVINIYGDDLDILCIDSRHPKLKELLNTYDVSFYHMASMKGKYDIRKYTKLK